MANVGVLAEMRKCINFFDVRVFNPYALTHRRQTMSSSFNANEREKRQYNKRIVEVEHGRSSSSPLVDVEDPAFPLVSG